MMEATEPTDRAASDAASGDTGDIGDIGDISDDSAGDTADDEVDPVVEAFDAVCRRLAGFDDTIDTEWADGYLTALAASPRRIEVDEWLPAMFGDNFERAFADPADVGMALVALQARLHLLRQDLDPEFLLDNPDTVTLAPLMQVWDDETRARVVEEGHATAEQVAKAQTGAAWAEGFFSAVDDFADDWPIPEADDELADTFTALCETIAALGWDPAGERFISFAKAGWKDADPSRDELIDEACFAVQDLRVYWLDHGLKHAPIRLAPKAGRNDPCPCGSGKKFKKCHGA